MLLQLHHKFDDGHTEFMAQREVTDYAGMKAFFREVSADHPLPEGADWICCDETAPMFMVKEIERNTKARVKMRRSKPK